MRIAVFSDVFLPNINGVVTSILNSTAYLAEKGHKILIFTSRPKGVKKSSKNGKELGLHENIDIEYYRPLNLIDYPDFQLSFPHPTILRKIRNFKPDVIHSHMPSFLGWEAVLCSKVFDIPIIGTYHTLLPDFIDYVPLPKNVTRSDYAKKFTWTYTRRYYNSCHLVTTPSRPMKQLLRKNGIKKPIIVLSNGIDLGRFYPREAEKNAKTILYVGRVSYEKNIDVIIKAFRILLKSQPKAKLLIAGKGPDMEKLKKESGKALGSQIIFLGAVAHEKLPELYSSADLFVTASTIETEGLVILEAMACGLPIVGVDRLAVPSIVRHGINGFIAPAHDEVEIYGHMEELLRKKELRERFSRQSVRLAQAYCVKNVLKELEKIYSTISRKSKKNGKKKISFQKRISEILSFMNSAPASQEKCEGPKAK